MPEIFFSSFVYGRVFGRPIESIGKERFMEYLELYNVGWIVAHRAETKRALEQFPHVAEVGQCENVTAYRVERPLSYVLQGRGVVAVDEFNNLVLDGLEGDSIILSYNYVQGLESTPAVEIEPISLMNGLPPFIRLVAPPHTVRLHLGR
jgi:hypothetical protein